MELKEIVLQDIKDCDRTREEQIGYIKDTLNHGCVSGNVGMLIYYYDTVQFYNDHKKEISALLYKMLENTGLSTVELFGDKFDSEDPLCLEQHNQNLLSWFAYEETARNLLNEEYGEEW